MRATVFRDELRNEEVATGTIVTDSDGRASFTFTPERGGVYKVLGVTEDADGNPARASRIVWVSGREYVQWRVDNDSTIEIVTDADEYNIGDTARLLITSPFQGEVQALVTVERNGVLTTDAITMTSNSLVYDLPITPGYAPNVFIGVMLIKGVDETTSVADYRYGLTQINVETSRKVVNIEITPDTDQAQPRDTVTYTVRTTDWAGEPISAQVGVGLTDVAALSLAPPNSVPLLNEFYGTQSLSVSTSSTLTINTDEITEYVRDVIKGGGGGGIVGGGVFEIRGNFVDTPYWNATLETDANGTAQFAVT
ncbi:MAG: hypothetical protein AAF125_10290, partial [Chloroflexota bacterium]